MADCNKSNYFMKILSAKQIKEIDAATIANEPIRTIQYTLT